MPAMRYDFVADQGATFARLILATDSAGVSLILTGYTAQMQVRTAYGAAQALLDLSTDNGGIVLGGAAGTIALLATPEQTSMIEVPDAGDTPPKLFAVYDLVLTSPAGVVTRYLEGQFIIKRRVSQ